MNKTQSVKKMIDRASAELFELRRSRNCEGLVTKDRSNLGRVDGPAPTSVTLR